MAQLFLLIKLRVLLGFRRYSGQKALFVLLLLFFFGMCALTVFLVDVLAHEHAALSPELSRRLIDLTVLGVATFLVGSILMGFRSNEYLDVSQLFQYPIRPLWLFLSVVLGHFLSPMTIMLFAILALPALEQLGGTPWLPVASALTLLYLLFLFTIVQCILLSLLNVLRSRRFGDLVAIMAPVAGLGMYAAMRTLIKFDGQPTELAMLLEPIDTAPFRAWLPPLWYAVAVYGDASQQLLAILALTAATILMCRFGIRLTVQAFHGEIAILPADKSVRQRRGLVRRIVSSLLPSRVAALYEKELTVIGREPWFRMLFLQQLGLVVLILLGTTLWSEGSGSAEKALTSAAVALVFVESGFLLNILGIEGPSFQSTALLPLPGTGLLFGKNLAHLHVLALVNLVLVPAMALVGSLLADSEFPTRRMALMLAIDLTVLPVMIGSGNLVSVFMPTSFGNRGRRVLGQERTGGDGCLATVLRSLLSFVALLPAVAVGFLLALPLIATSLDDSFYAISVPLAVLFAVCFYVLLTLIAGKHLNRSMHRTVRLLS